MVTEGYIPPPPPSRKMYLMYLPDPYDHDLMIGIFSTVPNAQKAAEERESHELVWTEGGGEWHARESERSWLDLYTIEEFELDKCEY